MQIFIDESGNLGKQGRYFVIACLVPPSSNRLKNLVKNCRRKFGGVEPLGELKGFGMPFNQRQEFINKLGCKKDFEFAYIVADKDHIHTQLISRQSVCFSYLVGHLLKPIIKNSTEDIEIVCDNRNIAVASGNTLQEYLQIKAYTDWGFRHGLTLRFSDSISCNHLQCVDVLSNTIYGKYSLNKIHFYNQLNPFKRHAIYFPYQKFGQ